MSRQYMCNINYVKVFLHFFCVIVITILYSMYGIYTMLVLENYKINNVHYEMNNTQSSVCDIDYLDWLSAACILHILVSNVIIILAITIIIVEIIGLNTTPNVLKFMRYYALVISITLCTGIWAIITYSTISLECKNDIHERSYGVWNSIVFHNILAWITIGWDVIVILLNVIHHNNNHDQSDDYLQF